MENYCGEEVMFKDACLYLHPVEAIKKGKFDIQVTEMVVQMQDFNASVHVETDRAGFRLIDKIIYQGTYDIKVTSGPLYIEADTILRDITANAYDPLNVC